MSAAADQKDLQYHYYLGTSALSKYSRTQGLLVIPVMGPTGTAPAVVRVSAPYGMREVEFEYRKQGSPPLFPAPADTTTGDVLLTADQEFPAPIPSPQGGLVYGVRGTHTYVQPLGGRAQGDTFPIDAHPIVTRVDTLGEDVTELTNPDDLVTYGQWTKDGVDTNQLTASKIIG